MPPLIPQDKANHIVYGGLIAVVALFIALLVEALLVHRGLLPVSLPQRCTLVALMVNIVFAVWKEWIYDKARPTEHSVDPWDFVATVLGGLLVAIPVMVATAVK